MTVKDMLASVRIDQTRVDGVVQITLDEEKTTIVYEAAKASGEKAQRVITVETEAVSFGN